MAVSRNAGLRRHAAGPLRFESDMSRANGHGRLVGGLLLLVKSLQGMALAWYNVATASLRTCPCACAADVLSNEYRALK